MDRTPDRSTDPSLGARTPVSGDGTQDAAHDAAHDAARAAATGQPAGATGSTARGDDGATDAGRTAAGVAGGMAAGTIAGLQAGALAGAVTLGVGAVAGAALGAAAGAALAQDADPGRFTAESDAHYRALYEAGGGPQGSPGYDAARPAYVFGHVAASEPALAGLTFEEAEPALERAWNDELRARAGDWPRVRHHVLDAYGHARAEGAGERRDPTVIGSGGSAVDPVELDRARHGLPSTGA